MFLWYSPLPLALMQLRKVNILLRIQININHVVNTLIKVTRIPPSLIELLQSQIRLHLILVVQPLAIGQSSVIDIHYEVL